MLFWLVLFSHGFFAWYTSKSVLRLGFSPVCLETFLDSSHLIVHSVSNSVPVSASPRSPKVLGTRRFYDNITSLKSSHSWQVSCLSQILIFSLVRYCQPEYVNVFVRIYPLPNSCWDLTAFLNCLIDLSHTPKCQYQFSRIMGIAETSMSDSHEQSLWSVLPRFGTLSGFTQIYFMWDFRRSLVSLQESYVRNLHQYFAYYRCLHSSVRFYFRKSFSLVTLAMTNPTEISTSSAVTELKLVYGVIALAFSLLNLAFIGLAFLLLCDLERNSSIESTTVLAFSTGWIILIELALFLGVLVSCIVVLFSVISRFETIAT